MVLMKGRDGSRGFPRRGPLISAVPGETRAARAHVAVVVVYFGPFPKWMNLHLATCAANPDVDWLILGDHPSPPRPPNVHRLPMTLQEFRSLARERLGMPVGIDTPYKVCDFRPAFGVILDEYLRRYDFWAHADLDICWGRIRHFITDADLQQYDIISPAPYQLCGHFTLYRNDSRVNNLFRANGEHQRVFQEPTHQGFDEIGPRMGLKAFTSTILELQRTGAVRVAWRQLALERSISWPWADSLAQLHRGRIDLVTLFRHQPVTRCYLHAGRVLTIPGNSEVMYFHFRNWGSTWTAMPGAEATTTRRWIQLSPASATVHSTLFGLLPSHLDRWLTGARLSAAWHARAAFRRLRTSVRTLASFAAFSANERATALVSRETRYFCARRCSVPALRIASAVEATNMKIVLWVFQVVLALAFLAHGLLLLSPPAAIADQLNASLPRWFQLFLGVAEMLAAVGLTLPAVTRIQPWLVPWAAVGIMVVMVSATIFHVVRGEISSALTTVVLLAMATFVAYMRWRVLPIKPRTRAGKSSSTSATAAMS